MRAAAFLACACALLSPVTQCAKSYTVVESLPLTNFSLPPIPGTASTTEALVKLVDGAQRTLDFTAMYWSLLATSPAGARPFSPTQLAALGASEGKALYDALDRAASRGVLLRVINGAGIGLPTELVQLQRKHPSVIQSRTWNATEWFGGGIMHQKVWVADRGASLYIGSANMDWLSLTQVKELGVVVRDSAPPAAVECGSALQLFENWWDWSALSVSSSDALSVFDYELNVNRTVPCWSLVVPEVDRCADPFGTPQCVAPSSSEYKLSAAPREVLGPGSRSPRTHWDLNMITHTILSARRTLDLSVMDILPSNFYGKPMGYLVWNTLFDAIATAAVTNGVRVRLLVSAWAHTSTRQPPYLKALLNTVAVCRISDPAPTDEPVCTGSLQVRQFRVPGWDSTDGPQAEFLPYSRVNHAKYLVTEQVANIGTSNWQWGYFYNTAGMSLNTEVPAVVSAVQQVFNRDWASSYATDL